MNIQGIKNPFVRRTILIVAGPFITVVAIVMHVVIEAVAAFVELVRAIPESWAQAWEGDRLR